MIYIREITEDDIRCINKFRNRRELMDALLAPFRYINPESDKEWFLSYKANRENNVRCAICLEETDEVIGVVYLLNINWIVRSGEFSIFIGDKIWRGKHYGESASIKMLEHAFRDLNLNRIQLKVLEINAQAISLYEKLGFKIEGIQRQAAFKNDGYRDVVLMSLLKDEFKE